MSDAKPIWDGVQWVDPRTGAPIPHADRFTGAAAAQEPPAEAKLEEPKAPAPTVTPPAEPEPG